MSHWNDPPNPLIPAADRRREEQEKRAQRRRLAEGAAEEAGRKDARGLFAEAEQDWRSVEDFFAGKPPREMRRIRRRAARALRASQ